MTNAVIVIVFPSHDRVTRIRAAWKRQLASESLNDNCRGRLSRLTRALELEGCSEPLGASSSARLRTDPGTGAGGFLGGREEGWIMRRSSSRRSDCRIGEAFAGFY